jgi:kynureninase
MDAYRESGAQDVGCFDRRVSIKVPRETLTLKAGARQLEVACMNTLTSNIHTLLSAFYKPTKTRFKILYELKAFPSDIVSLPRLACIFLNVRTVRLLVTSHVARP